MLDDDLKTQLAAYLERVTQPFEIIATLGTDARSRDLLALLTSIADLSEKISLRTDGSDARVPSFRLNRLGYNMGVEFAAIPLGHEFTSLVLALLWVGGHPPKADTETIDRIRALEGDFQFEVYMSLSCHNCPDVVQALTLMAVLNPKIRVVTIDGALFEDEVKEREILAVPSIYLNGAPFGTGRMGVEEILGKLDQGSAQRDAQRLSAKAPYDVLIIGGGPAGSAAAVYAARKGIRTGLAAVRLGGQVNDTLGIENYISILHTEGPHLAQSLEEHVRHYGVDVMTQQTAEKLIPATEPGGLIEVRFQNGGSLQARTVLLSTGARWRQVGVPGEEEYRNRGVAYCPHCDGPLFKGKPVAVIGGGNSGVEAAIDLAGVAEHVTLIEFAEQLRADAVLVKQLRALGNVTIITHAQTISFSGDGKKLVGLTYRDRASGIDHQITVDGAFVQIGLVPNTEWLRGTLELSRHGEIVIDERGATSLPGVFAAGDATTAPFKQIVIAAGDGAKAALAAFDHLVRHRATSPVMS